MGKIDPKVWDRFDMVAVQDYVGYSRTRTPRLRQCLERVGLLSRATWFWSFRTPYSKVFARSVRLPYNDCKDEGTFNCTLGHYAILKTAYELGKQSVLVMEDDARFLKDPLVLSDIVRSLPNDFDFAKFEWFNRKVDKSRLQELRAKYGNPYWVPVVGFGILGCGLYAMSRKGMEWKLRNIENSVKSRVGHKYVSAVFHSIDRYDGFDHFDRDMKVYAALPVAVVQSNAFSAIHVRNKPYRDFLFPGDRGAYDAEESV